MRGGPADQLDPDIAGLLHAAQPYPDAPAHVQLRVQTALALRIADLVAAGSTGIAADGGLARRAPEPHGLLSLAANPIRAIAATFLVGAGVGAALNAAIRPPRERIVYVERAFPVPSVDTPADEDRSSPRESTPTQAVESALPLRRGAPPAKSENRGASSLGPEQHLLDIARRALVEGRGADALGPLDRHAQRYPKGVLAEERDALTINVLVTLGRYDEARLRSARFLRQYPGSLLRASVEAAVGAIP